MDEKDKKIQALEKELTHLKKIMVVFEKQLKHLNSRSIHTNENVRRIDAIARKAQQGVDQLRRQ